MVCRPKFSPLALATPAFEERHERKEMGSSSSRTVAGFEKALDHELAQNRIAVGPALSELGGNYLRDPIVISSAVRLPGD